MGWCRAGKVLLTCRGCRRRNACHVQAGAASFQGNFALKTYGRANCFSISLTNFRLVGPVRELKLTTLLPSLAITYL